MDSSPKPHSLSPGEAYMSAAMRAHFVQLLHTRQRLLMADLDRTLDLTSDEATSLSSSTGGAGAQEETASGLSDRDRNHEMLMKIDSALQRLATEAYGWCERCEAEIGVRRLEAQPTASLCLECKALEDRDLSTSSRTRPPSP